MLYMERKHKRANDNFQISGIKFGRGFIEALGTIKAAAITNMELDLLDEKTSIAIQKAAEEVKEGKHDYHFVIDIFQTDSVHQAI